MMLTLPMLYCHILMPEARFMLFATALFRRYADLIFLRYHFRMAIICQR